MTKRECAYCAEQFDSITEHLTHVIQTHDAGFVADRSKRLRRPTVCRMCLADIPHSSPACVCGWVKPQQGETK